MKKIDLKAVKSVTAKAGIWLVLLILIIVSALLNKNFLTANNMLNIARQCCVYVLIAYAEAILIISGSIDLSAGSCLAFAGVLSVPVCTATGSVPLAIITALFVGIGLYFISGACVAFLDIPPFVATLAMMTIARGGVKLYTGGMPITKTDPSFKLMGQGYIGAIPIPVIVIIVVTVIMYIIMTKTRFGRNLYAVGGNPAAAMASGINLKKYRLLSYVVAGILVGMAGFMLASRTNAGIPTAGSGYEGQGISAAIIGGVAFAGGEGSIIGVLGGAFVMGVISNILNLLGVDSYVQEIINGSIILVAVVIDITNRKSVLKK